MPGGGFEDWRRTGRGGEGLEEDWRRVGGEIGGGLKEDWRRIGIGLEERPIFRPIVREAHCLGSRTRINIYVDARFGPQKPAQGMIFTIPEAQYAHQHLR